MLQSYRDLLADLPDVEDVQQDARMRFPSRELLQETYARIQFAGHYLRAKYALQSLIERLERENQLRTDSDEPDSAGRAEGETS